ncbi:MAG: EAL and HDOD domain-containing protein [Spirochaetota bacterium]
MENKIYSAPTDTINVAKGIYIARQPIFDRHAHVFGYELLFREGFHNFYNTLDGDYASSQTILSSFLLFGMDSMTGGKRGFINFTETLLYSEAATMFPKELLTIEILETVEPTYEIISKCKKLKKAGYMLALDDFVFHDKYRPLLEIADIVKIDFRKINPQSHDIILTLAEEYPVKLLAEKVETYMEYNQALSDGYSYFQGYFFSKPQIIEGRDIPGNKLSYLEILREVHSSNFEYSNIENIIKRDMSLSYKLLKFINSAAFGFTSKIHSIKQALTLLGIKEFRKWISLMALSAMGEDKPEELVATSIIRARFAEELAMKTGMKEISSDLFLMGMFSLIDAFVDKPKDIILSELNLDDDIKDALIGRKQGPLTDYYTLMLLHEKGNWTSMEPLANKLSLNEEAISLSYLQAVEWANRVKLA